MTQLFNQKEQTVLRKYLRLSVPKSETILWKHLCGKNVGYKFRRQFGIGKYVVDFYCPKLRLAVEIDGVTHEGEKKIQNDIERQLFIESLGIVVMRFMSEDIFYRLNEVLNEIQGTCHELETSPNPSFVRRGQPFSPSL